MRLSDWKSHWSTLHQQLLALEGGGEFSQSGVLRMIYELELFERSYTARRRRERSAPVLRDVVAIPAQSGRPRPDLRLVANHQAAG